ncbi:MAG: ribonuclease HII [Candidatus Heimdallarchaeota archaeon]|nr:ribonuclease HII [Candidatus Heimdallarchaeota archaeon]
MLKEVIVAGVDEAGRGPVLGPLVIAGVTIDSSELPSLCEKGLRDSKLLSPKKREKLYDLILNLAENYKIVILSAEDIDEGLSRFTLNSLSVNTMIDILSSLENWSKAYVDACDVNAERCQRTFRNRLREAIIVEHYADKKYPVVSAASVLAKVVRDREIQKAHEEFGIDFGSGYCHDHKTTHFLIDYLNEYGKLPRIARKTWETSKRIVRSFQQTSLKDFFSEPEIDGFVKNEETGADY